MVTIYSIAERCQVSTATVSRALTRPEMVSEELCRRILQTAEEMGYRANRSARRLASGRSGLIATLVPDITNAYFPPLVRELDHLLADSDGATLIVDTDEDPEREVQAIDRLRGEVDGFVLISPRAQLRDLQSALSNSRCVLVNRPSRILNAVTTDESQAMIEIVGELKALGHGRIAYLSGPDDSWVNTRRGTLLARAAQRQGVDHVRLGPFPAHAGAGPAAAASLLESGATAAVAFDDLIALGVMRELFDLGVRVPHDLSIVGCDRLALDALSRPALTSIGADPARVAREVVALLRSAVAGQLAGREARVAASVKRRESVGQAAPRTV